MAALLKVVDITKEFSGVRVLNQISMELQRGEVLGIIGENGAGKSTFTKILCGTYTPTAGQIWFDGQPVRIRDAFAARNLGITAIPQELNLVEHLKVYENVFLGRELRKNRFLLDRKGMIERTRALFDELETAIDPEAVVAHLSVAEKQMVEIAKALAFDSRLLIMDEPTTVLTQHEVDVLFHIIAQLKEKGVTIIYISHKLKEVKSICDRVMILRDGNLVSIDPAADLTEAEMARRMVGRELSQVFPEKVVPQTDVVLQVRNLTVPGVLYDISFDLHKGEILGLAGLTGAGRTELAEALMGIRRPTAGQIIINGQERKHYSPRDAVKSKLAYLSEDRQGIGLVTRFSVVQNVTLVSLRSYARYLVNAQKEKQQAERYVEAFGIKTPSIYTPVERLSGGNQQKVSLAKSLDPGPEILIVDEPTRGIDVNAKREVYQFLKQLVTDGISCIFISAELEELLGMCNRVAVMRSGRIAGILTGDHLNEEEIMYHATGVKGAAAV